VPLIFHAAGQTHGIKSNSLVESVDIYPTLAALVCVCQCLASLLGPFQLQLKLLSHTGSIDSLIFSPRTSHNSEFAAGGLGRTTRRRRRIAAAALQGPDDRAEPGGVLGVPTLRACRRGLDAGARALHAAGEPNGCLNDVPCPPCTSHSASIRRPLGSTPQSCVNTPRSNFTVMG
jgi:hypothetical protein